MNSFRKLIFGHIETRNQKFLKLIRVNDKRPDRGIEAFKEEQDIGGSF